jgi:hypothetical protein
MTGTPPPQQQPPRHGSVRRGARSNRGTLGAAVLGGLVGAFIGGGIWTAIVAATKIQAAIVAIGVGWIVAEGVLLVADRHSRLPLQVVAAICTAIGLVCSEYFVARLLYIDAYETRGIRTALPIWESFDFAKDLVRERLSDDPVTWVFWAAAVVTAVIVAGTQQSAVRS